MATQLQYNTAVQPYRNISIKIEVLDFNYYILDDISGIATSAKFSINADSDIRRTCNIDMVLKDKYSTNPLSNFVYWEAGNPFWFDKYLKIYIGIDDIASGERVWSNQGIYLINEPSLVYDAETNSLSFEGVDLMAKLTGMRNGNLEGMGYEIPVGSNIKNTIISILAEQGFKKYVFPTVLPQDTTPYDIKVNAGGTSYDLLSQLRDIMPNWEMFFDVDGVFYFQEITANATSDYYITPFVDADTFKLLHSSAQLDTSFEDVKNYIEVYGKAIDAPYAPTSVTINNNILDIIVAESTFTIDSVYDYSFTLGKLDESPVLLATPITQLHITIGTGISSTITIPDSLKIKYTNMSYVFRISGQLGISSWSVQYLGYAQPFGMAWDGNEQSPFYVGQNVNEWDARTSYNSLNDVCYYNNICYKNKVIGNYNHQPPNSTYWTVLYEVSDYSDAIYHKPKFKKQVRIVLSGGEYDNIYSNDLAIQRAKYEVYLRSTLHDNIQITLLPIYWMDVNQIIEYQMPNESEPSYWLVKTVSTDFSVDGQQTITAIRYYFEE